MIHVVGMQGLGDNLHQRAIVRQLLQRDTLQLETPWPSVYHDLVGPRLSLVYRMTTLRTQVKNVYRQAALYSLLRPADSQVRIWYRPETVRRVGSVFGAMVTEAGCDLAAADFRLPIADTWHHKLAELGLPSRPILLYRPLVERTEWGGCSARNPDRAVYAELLRSIRDDYFVVSVADLQPGKEWIVGEPIEADATFHAGELEFETLAALTSTAALVFASPGFAIPLAQAVGTPSVCIFGGYENASSFSAGAKFAPHLAIDPINSCQCFSHHHRCDKRIDVPAAVAKLAAFIENLEEPCSAPNRN